METVTNEIGKFPKKREGRFLHHVNVEAIQLLENSELVRRPKRKKPFELVWTLKAEESEVHHKHY